MCIMSDLAVEGRVGAGGVGGLVAALHRDARRPVSCGRAEGPRGGGPALCQMSSLGLMLLLPMRPLLTLSLSRMISAHTRADVETSTLVYTHQGNIYPGGRTPGQM